MPKAKKSVKLRDQKPMKDPVGGVKNKSLNTVTSEGAIKNRHHHGGTHSHF
jgi:hypothetical protein